MHEVAGVTAALPRVTCARNEQAAATVALGIAIALLNVALTAAIAACYADFAAWFDLAWKRACAD